VSLWNSKRPANTHGEAGMPDTSAPRCNTAHAHSTRKFSGGNESR
jgi:hypothetical protein